MRRVDRHLTEQERDLAAAELARSVPGHPGKTILDLTFALPSLKPMALALTEALGSTNDVRQVAALGVMRAAQTFDPARGKVATYVVFQIKAALARELVAAGRQRRRVPEGVAVLSLGAARPPR